MLVKKYSKTKPTCKVTFTLAQEAIKGAKSVNLVGEFNDWNLDLAIPMKKQKNQYEVTLELPVGKDYQFRYKADNGIWENDWAADAYIEAPYQVCNSVVSLSKNEAVQQKVKSSSTTKTKATSITKTSSASKKKVVDDLKKIEGIGPKIAELLVKAGIKTFADLSAAKKSTLKGILEAAGNRYKMHDPSTWANQAKLAAKGNWAKLEALQAKLNGGKK